MHKKTSKRILLTQKSKHPQPSTAMTIHQIGENGLKNHCPMVSGQNTMHKMLANFSQCDISSPSLPRADEDSWSWDRRSSGTSISWPEEMEEVATKKVIEQWDAVQRTLYDEDNQVTEEVLRAECIQWRTQRPHLRVVGKGLQGCQVGNENAKEPAYMGIKENNTTRMVEEIIEEHSVPVNGTEDSPKQQFREQTRREVLDRILEFVCTQLMANNEDEESLSQNLDTVLRITPAPTYSGRNVLRDHTTATEFVIPTHRKTKLHKEGGRGSLDDCQWPEHLPEVRNCCHADKGRKILSGGSSMPISARRQRDIRDMTADGKLMKRDRLYTPQLPRNALGTVFNEKIIVSPVPFATSTKESFSTLKSTPIGSIRSLESSLRQRSARSVNSSFKASPARRAGLLQMPVVHSAWQAPVCPTVWPKNVKLAPIDITRFPSGQRRSFETSLVQPRRNRNSLSPIPREIMPVSPLASRDSGSLEIHGKQIVRQKSRMGMTSAGWDSSPRNMKKIRKKVQKSNER